MFASQVCLESAYDAISNIEIQNKLQNWPKNLVLHKSSKYYSDEMTNTHNTLNKYQFIKMYIQYDSNFEIYVPSMFYTFLHIPV